MRKVITAILVDPKRVEELRSERKSFSEIFEMCTDDAGFDNPPRCSLPSRAFQRVILTPLQAAEFKANKFGEWAGRNRMILPVCRRDFAKLRDLSAVAGFDRAGETGKEGEPALDASWIGTFLRDRFEKGRRCL